MKKVQAPAPRLNFIFAKEAPIALVLRRGPTKWTQIIRWHTDSDKFEEGHWFHGKIYSERCSLSPNGKLFLYFAFKKSKADEGYEQTYTAISKPPWLTALALWPQGGTWGGGGLFVSNSEVELGYTTEFSHHPMHPPVGLKINYGLKLNYDPNAGLPISKDEIGIITGEDLSGKSFIAREGKIFRIKNKKERLIADFANTEINPMPSPGWAKIW